MYAQSKNGLGEWDVGSIVGTLVKGYGDYSAAKAQADIIKSQAKLDEQRAALERERQQAALLTRFNPQYSDVYSGGAYNSGFKTSNLMPILLIGGLAIAAFLILRK